MKKVVLYIVLFPLICFSQWEPTGNPIFGENENDQSGRSIDLNASGNVLAIGAPFNDQSSNLAGVVRIFENLSNVWVQKGANITGLQSGNYFGSSLSLSDDGNTIAVGAPEANDNGFESGLVRVFKFQSENWVQLGDPILGSGFSDLAGTSVSINGDGTIVAFGAPEHDTDTDSNAGMVRIFQFQSNHWQQLGVTLIGSDADFFGYSVSLNQTGDIIAVGAPFDQVNSISSGAVHLFQYNSGNWIQLGNAISSTTDLDRIGSSVSLNDLGNRIAIGATHHNPNGLAVVYEYHNTDWIQLANTLEGEVLGEQFGHAVSLNGEGNIMAVSDHKNGHVKPNAGHVRVFQLLDNQWQQIGNDIDGLQTNQWVGFSISLNDNGDTLAVGAPLTDDNSINSVGSTTIYSNASVLNVETNTITSRTLIYPNPTQNFINIKFPSTQNYLKLTVYDAVGKTQLQKTYYNINTLRLSLENLPSGFLFLEIANEIRRRHFKIMKQN